MIYGPAADWIERVTEAGDPSAKAVQGTTLWKTVVDALAKRKAGDPMVRNADQEDRALRFIRGR
jgi:hypothetical protein